MRRLLPLLAVLHLPLALAAGPQTTTLASGITVETYRVGETGSSPTLADVVRVHTRARSPMARSSTAPTAAAARPSYRSRR
jgi:hypothetical protein